MRYTIYKVTNKVNNKFYIGKHQTMNPNDSYYGSGKAIMNSIRKYGKENFIKEILYDFDSEIEMNEQEKDLITEEFVSRSDTYNLGIGGEGGPHFKGRKHSRESIEKSINTRKNNGMVVSIETRQKLSNKLKNRVFSEEHKRKLSEYAKNRPPRTSENEVKKLWEKFCEGEYKSIRSFAKATNHSHNNISTLFKKYIPEYITNSNKPYKSLGMNTPN